MSESRAQRLVVSEGGTRVLISLENDHERRCSSKWVRFNCQCEKCKKSLDKTVLDCDIVVREAEISGDEVRCLTLDGANRDHTVVLPLKYLLCTCNCDCCIRNELNSRKSAGSSANRSVPYFDYSKLSTDLGLFKCLQLIMERGFCIIRGFPVNDNEIALDFGRSLGGIRSTLYGHDWDVRSEVKPINIAYTPFQLPSHQDLLMYEHPPGVQFLLSLRFDQEVRGGCSIIVDALECAEILREKHPEHFKTLSRVPGTHVTIDMDRAIPAWFWHPKPHIEVDYFGEISRVNWHSTLEGTLRIKEKDAEAYYAAHKAFIRIFQDEKNQFRFRLQTGDMLILNNRRVTHAREAFQSVKDGDRHLLGFYINMDDLKCRYMTLAESLGVDVVAPKIGNGSSF